MDFETLSSSKAPNFWPFVSKYTHRSIKTQISTLNQIHNEIGRARAWIRIVLNEYALDHYISLFSKDTKQMNQFYAVDAFLRDFECISSLDALLKRLNGIRIAAPTNSSLLNAWTPSPLMLAGLIKGTPTVRAAHTSRCAVAGVPLDVPSSSLSPNGLLPMGKGFRTGSSSPSAASSSAMLLQDDALAAVDAVSMTIASGEGQIVAEFGMEADQLLLVAEQTEGPISAEEQHQQQGASSSSAAAMADDLESVYSHPSMMEDHSSSSMLNSVLVGTSEHHQRRRQNAQNYYNSNNKWIMASMPTEELSAEVVVHRKAKQRHRRRTMSRSSCGGGSDSSCGGGGGGADGSSSRCQSSANLHTFAESVESKEENASTVTDAGDEERQHRAVGAVDNVQQQEAPVFEEEMPAFIALNDALSTEGTAMGFDIEQLQNQPHFFVNSSLPSSPPFGTSLQDELLAAAAAAVAGKEDDGGERFAGEELARKKFSATDEQHQHQQMARDLLINSKIVSSSAKVSFSYSTDSMDDELLHNTSGSVPAMPATFDEALRNFLGREAQKRRRSSRARTSSSTTNVRLFPNVHPLRPAALLSMAASVTFFLANLHTFAESVESKEENASTVTDAGDEERQHRAVGAVDNVQQQEAPVFEEEMPAFIALNDALSTEGTAMGFDIEQLQQNQPHFFVNSSLPSSPPFGTSLQDELLAAAAAAVAGKEDDGGERFAGEELARKKFSATDEQHQHQQMARDLLINSKIVSSSAKVSFSYSTDSMDDELLHNTSGSVPAMPATFDEALRNFLGREAQKQRRSSRARTSSSTTNVRLFSECSSSSAGGAAQHEQLQSPSSYPTSLSSPQQLTSSPTTALAQSVAANNGHSTTKRGSAATVTAFLFLAKELAPEPFKREEREAKNQLDAEEEAELMDATGAANQQQQRNCPKCLRRAKYCSASTMLLLNTPSSTTAMMNSISNNNDSSSGSAATAKLPPLSPRDEQ
uniref:RUN domain-containing protein n=1 Tax=Globodera pallida TaxID=36090 RepID=A0A183CN18_GLOPA